jgi:hypothetical protein
MKMANEIRYDRTHHSGAGPEERIRNRLRNSGGDGRAGHTIKVGDGAQRLFNNVHDKGAQQFNVRQKGDKR